MPLSGTDSGRRCHLHSYTRGASHLGALEQASVRRLESTLEVTHKNGHSFRDMNGRSPKAFPQVRFRILLNSRLSVSSV
jgi:hypothetical protein